MEYLPTKMQKATPRKVKTNIIFSNEKDTY